MSSFRGLLAKASSSTLFSQFSGSTTNFSDKSSYKDDVSKTEGGSQSDGDSRRPSFHEAQRQTDPIPSLTFYQRWFTKPVFLPPPVSQHESYSSPSVSPPASRSASPNHLRIPSSSEIKTRSRRDSSPMPPQSAQTLPLLGGPPRKFSFRARGSIFAAITLVMLLLTALSVSLAVTLTRASRHLRAPPTYSEPGDQPFAFSTKPVRLGILTNFPDPAIIYEEDSKTWYAYGTNDAAGILRPDGENTTDPNSFAHSNIQIATSKDFKTWDLHNDTSDPLPHPGSWALQGQGHPVPGPSSTQGDRPDITPASRLTDSTNTHKNTTGNNNPQAPLANVWAPEVIQRPSDKKWVMYYSAAVNATPPAHCIGAASADSPSGPFTPGDKPLACPTDDGGAIDPAAFEDDDGTIYVLYKIDGNSRGHGGECLNTVPPIHSTPIMLQKMQADGVTPDGEPVQILDRTKEDGPLVEAPSLIKSGDTYYLFYSSGCTRSPSYDVRYATAKSVAGPYTRAVGKGKDKDSPLFGTGSYQLVAPGSVSVKWASDPSLTETNGGQGGWKIALHARVSTGEGGVRAMFTAGLAFDNGKVQIVPGSMSVTGD